MRVRRSLGIAVRFFLTIAFAEFVFSTPALAQCNSNDSTAPCFTGNTDILGGRGSLLRNDDLVFATTGSTTPIGSILQTTGSTVTTTIPSSLNDVGIAATANMIVVRGRLFDVDHDQFLSAGVTRVDLARKYLASLEGSDASITVPTLSVLVPPSNINGLQLLYGASGDFLGNGYDQMVVMAARDSQLVFQALAAVNPTSTTGGLQVGAMSAPVSNISGAYAITAGVFSDPQTGTPLPPAQLAVLSRSPTTNQGLVVTFYAVDSQLNVTATGQSITLTLPSGAQGSPSTIAISAGRFSGGTHDQLAIAYPMFNNNSAVGTAEVTIVDFDSQGNPTQLATSDSTLQVTTATGNYSAAIYLAKGKFNWFGVPDELGISVGTDGEGNAFLGVMSFDQSSLVGTMGSPYKAQACHFGLAAGRFDNLQSDGQINPNVQLGDMATACMNSDSNNIFTGNIYDVDPNSYAVTLHSQPTLTLGNGIGPPELGNLALSLVAGDEESRSLALGPPEKVTVTSHLQPDTVLGLPPMHADWITAPLSSSPEIYNVSVFPTILNAAYSFSDSVSGSVNRSQTTSYTLATKETVGEKVSYGVAGLGGVSVQANQAATQLHQSTVAAKYNTYTGLSQNFTAATGFDDTVAATVSQLNIYSYPVLGQCDTGVAADGVCPNGGSPLYVQFSGPDNVTYIDAENGANAEWYQPVQEPGNIFSYPVASDTAAQLANNLGGGTQFTNLSALNTTWDPQSTSSLALTWKQGGGSSVTNGSTATHTFDTSVSASGNVSFAGLSASASTSFDYNDSSSLSTLNQMTSSFSSSQGVTLSRGISSNDSAPDYQGSTVIYSQTSPTGTIQSDAAPVPVPAFSTQGYIAVGHMVDMMSTQSPTSSPWWVQQYHDNGPDIALNHPSRWAQKYIPDSKTQELQFNCPYGYTSSLASPPTPCTSASGSGPSAGYQDAPFYQMKGLFVTPGGTANGPQIASATLGSQVNLRVRVYNYSLANFPAGSTLNVQFYAQPFAFGVFTAGTNSDGLAPAVFIGNGKTVSGGTPQPPPAFCGGAPADGSDPCTDSSPNNRVDVYTTWDTGQSSLVTAGSTWKFWVVIWVTDSNGNLYSELPGHGLTSLPAASVQYNSLADVPIEPYSNNLGFYNQVFTVLAAASSTDALTSVKAAAPVSKQLTLGKIATRSSAPVIRDVPITILAPQVASGDHVDSILTLYYDGDPSKGGTLFDTQSISRVPVGSPYIDTASFTAKTCGPHLIFVRSIPTDGTAPVATATNTFKVTSDPVIAINQLIIYVNAPDYPPRFRNAILSYLNAAKRSFTNKQTQSGTIQMQVLLNLVNGGAFFVPANVQQALENQMSDLLGCL